MRSFGNGMVGQSWATCDQCDGEGKKVRDKDRCKKCKGKKTVTQKKKLELRIERGMLDGQKIELAGENDEEVSCCWRLLGGDDVVQLKCFSTTFPTYSRASPKQVHSYSTWSSQIHQVHSKSMVSISSQKSTSH